MTETESGSKWKKVAFTIVIIIFIIGVLIALLVGLQSLKTFFFWLFLVLLLASIGFGLGFLFWLIFLKKEYKDIPANYKKKLIQTATLMKNEMLGDLYLSGDTKHNRIKLGRFRYMRLTMPRLITKKTELKPDEVGYHPFQNSKEEHFTKSVNCDCFVIMKNSIIEKMFGDPKFILCKPQDHNFSSIFNDVTINGFNLVPLDSQFYTIDTRNLDVDLIKGITTSYNREVIYEIFRDLDRLIKQAINLDQSHIKGKERNMEFEIPFGRGGGSDDRR